MNQEKVLKEFCELHAIMILDTNKRAHRFSKMNLKYFQNSLDFNVINDTVSYETEPLYTIEISKSELEKIANFESQVFRHMKAKGHYDLFHMIMQQKEEEKRLANQYPAVKKAYEQYSLMLKMATAGELEKT